MDNNKSSEKETHDFTNVESFSQLPFIRPQVPVKEKGIRLFGIEFGSMAGGRGTTTAGEECEGSSAETNVNEETNVDNNNSRRFECHYCCRNFPTSQALGGHQNAHKRERQHAKRAHLHSAGLHNNSQLLSHDAHFYGLMNYTTLAAAAAAPAPPKITYPSSWRTTTASTTTDHRFYGSHSSFYHHQAPTINGSPLGLWRIPGATSTAVQSHRATFNRDHSFPLFASDQELKPSYMQVGDGGGGSSSQSRFVYESKPGSQDHVSLDLHL